MMTEDLKVRFLRLAIIEQKKYDEIGEILKITKKDISRYWEDLKEEREHLSNIRKIWKVKYNNPETTETFWDFKKWYDSVERKCYYCGITETEIEQLWKKEQTKNKALTERNRGKKLEIERLSPKEPYHKIDNLVLSCYWCNNAKTDTFTAEEFKEIGETIGKIWKKRLTE
ncbi:hypothetical protein [Bacteroides propionicifaciens]|uniref:hypothetical protein n=1 Tax=Bacteroides propionicifaciens TaxID=392838 RepID=UPI00035FE847|nr:hypothetical protein [Bacteroides propionicifaciens]